MIQPMRKVDERDYRESGSHEEQSRWTSFVWAVVALAVAVPALVIFDFGWPIVFGVTLLVAAVQLLLWARKRG
ncbi:hypothetical protein EV380_2536 [Zhihengliuella halotolerans]|uniref:Uncharacterized protein n=2 Tax=Zhihengliuella halotolerans TaxID=370736 RepID=A0A4Q8AGF4_9MICC|nr:hypothetical protein EV380_2536 [Zhihengliuella halotolerans]